MEVRSPQSTTMTKKKTILHWLPDLKAHATNAENMVTRALNVKALQNDLNSVGHVTIVAKRDIEKRIAGSSMENQTKTKKIQKCVV